MERWADITALHLAQERQSKLFRHYMAGCLEMSVACPLEIIQHTSLERLHAPVVQHVLLQAQIYKVTAHL